MTRARAIGGKTRGLELATRPLVTGVIALMMLVQSFVAFGKANASFDRSGADSVLTAYSIGANCSVDPAHEDDSPARSAHNCSQCCILCRIGGCLAQPIVAGLSSAGLNLRSSGVSTVIASRVLDHDHGSPAGWTSSWSSRAPPAVS